MPDVVKRIMVSLPESLLAELDILLTSERCDRNEFIREATRRYLVERKRMAMREHMKRGYLEMAKINLTLAMEGYAAESDADAFCQRHVMEC